MIDKFLTHKGLNKGPEISIKGRNYRKQTQRDGKTIFRMFTLISMTYFYTVRSRAT